MLIGYTKRNTMGKSNIQRFAASALSSDFLEPKLAEEGKGTYFVQGDIGVLLGD